MKAFDFYKHALKTAFELSIGHYDQNFWMEAIQKATLKSVATVFSFVQLK